MSEPALSDNRCKSGDIPYAAFRSYPTCVGCVWCPSGFAVSSLLPSSVKSVTLAMLDRYAYTFDDWGSWIRRTTGNETHLAHVASPSHSWLYLLCIVYFHDKIKQPFRVKAAYHWSRDHSCPTNVSIHCERASLQWPFSKVCNLRPNNASCPRERTSLHKTNYMHCQYYSLNQIRGDSVLAQFCIGQRADYRSNFSSPFKRSKSQDWINDGQHGWVQPWMLNHLNMEKSVQSSDGTAAQSA